MKIISVSGYGFTGSGLVLDLLLELNDSLVIEFRELQFLSDPFGVSDLEYALCDVITKSNADFYIKMFQSNISLNTRGSTPYTDVFGNRFKEIANEYINSLILFSKIDRPYYENKIITNRRISMVNSINNFGKKLIPVKSIRRLIKNFAPVLFEPIIPKKTYYSFPGDQFIAHTKDFTSKLFQSITDNKTKVLVLNQLIHPTNPTRFLRYVSNCKAIVVDRDPRDLFIENTKKNHDKYMRMSVKEFVKYYKGLRSENNLVYPSELSNILRINFEDIIYNQSLVFKKISTFLELSEELTGKFIDLQFSSKNTKLFNLDENLNLKDEIDFIKEHLSDHLYKFKD